MKKLCLFTLIMCLLLSSVTALAYGVTVDGLYTDCSMEFEKGTVYLCVEEVARTMGKTSHWDEKTQTVFVNGIYLFPKKGENITIYVDGEKKIEGEGMIINGKTYLPAHIVAAAFDLTATWDDKNGEVRLTSSTPSLGSTDVDENLTYAIINKSTGEALSVVDGALTTLAYTKEANQQFKFIKTEFEGYYHIQSTQEKKNLDVNAHGTTAGVSIILWEQGAEDNQKFALEAVGGGTLIYSRNRNLPIEPSGGGIIQNTRTLSSNQKWEIIPFGSAYSPKAVSLGEPLKVTTVPEKPQTEEERVSYYTFEIDNKALADSGGLTVISDKGDSTRWILNEISKDVYVITNLATNKSIDVSARSLNEGGSIITYSTNSDANQRWILEKQSDGAYLIKSVHSSLYLTISEDGSMVQMAKDSALKQSWTVTVTN